jgi:DNA-binding phage protein
MMRNIYDTLLMVGGGIMTGSFWDDLAHDLEDPEFLREYITQSVRIATTDAIINALDEARVAEGLSKAEIARAIGTEPAAVRRLFASGNTDPNPTLGTLVAVAAALGLRLRVEPLSLPDRSVVTEPLRTGRAPDDMQRIVMMRRRKQRRSTAPA